MNRRTFLAAVLVAPLAAAVAPLQPRPPRVDLRALFASQRAINQLASAQAEMLSLRCVRQYDVSTSSQTRLDVFYGMATLRPDLACRVLA